MLAPQFPLPLDDELIVDLFAGGGGASEGIEEALGRPVDIAVNHDSEAVAMHLMNHPRTEHHCSDVYEVCPVKATRGRPVGHLHASPDCTHHSQARGGQPRSRAIRSLSWVVHRWAGQVRPRVITLENVEQILQWSPLVAKRCPKTSRVLKLDGTVAAPGERVPLEQQFLVPDRKRKGHNWGHFVDGLRRMGYAVQWKTLVAADYGAPTTRERLYMVARCDSEPIVWPEPTHISRKAAKKAPKATGCKPWRSAAECIDWSIACPSIFERERPLADATMRRIARGVRKFVLESADPFIVRIGQMGSAGDHVRDVRQPVSTVTSKNEHALVTPTLVQMGYGERPGQAPRALDLQQPLGTVVAGGLKHGVVAPTLMPLTHQGSDRVIDVEQPLPTVTAAHRGELALASAVLVGVGGPEYSGKPSQIDNPLGTVVASSHRAVAAATLIQFRHEKDGKSLDAPLPTITAGGACKRPAGAPHAMGLAVAYLAQQNGGFNDERGAPGHDARRPLSTVSSKGSHQQVVAAFLSHAYGSNTNGGDGELRRPAKTITTGGHHAIVECTLSPEQEAGALRVAAFLMHYYGEGGQLGDPGDPAATITTKDRLALVTVTIKGTPYVIVDIGLRMLQPAELYRAQGFPGHYVIDRTVDGKRLSKSAQVRMCGNSVSPPPMQAIVAANHQRRIAERRAA